MKKETKQSLKRNSGIIVFALIIIGAILYSDLTKFPIEEFKFVIMLMALFILWQVTSQALSYESKKIQKRIITTMTILVVVLFIIGLLVFALYK